MSFFAPIGGAWRPPYLGKAAIVSPYRGLLRAQKWPRKRGLPKNQRSRGHLQKFKLYQAMAKQLREVEISALREAIKNHNRTHRGQRGSAAIRMRDWTHQRLAGRGFAFTTPMGITFYPPAVHRDASKILDHAAFETHSFLSRQDHRWDLTQGAAPGRVLTAGQPGEPAQFKPLP